MNRSRRAEPGAGPEPLRVLLVDDTPEIRLLLEVGIDGIDGCELVGEAQDGEEAVEKAELLHPDLIIMDMMMPVMNGVEATRSIKSAWPDIEILGFTSAGPERAHDMMQGAGADETFDKLDLTPMLDAVRRRAAARGWSQWED